LIRYEASCFGKLPLHGDFIRHRASGEPFNRLDRWIQEGMFRAAEKLGEEAWRAAYVATPPLRFIVRYPGASTYAVGVLVPGQDKVGRLFPFLAFTTVEHKALRKQPALLPLLLDDFLARAEELATQGWRDVDGLAELKARVDALAGDADPKATGRALDDYLGRTTTDALWQSGFEGPAERRELALMNFHGLVGPRSKPRFVLWLPPAPSPELIAFWLDALSSLRGRDAFPCLTFWSAAAGAEAARGLRFLLAEPVPSHFVPVLMPDRDPEGACDLSREGLESPGLLEKARAACGPLTADGGLSLTDLVRRLERL